MILKIISSIFGVIVQAWMSVYYRDRAEGEASAKEALKGRAVSVETGLAEENKIKDSVIAAGEKEKENRNSSSPSDVLGHGTWILVFVCVFCFAGCSFGRRFVHVPDRQVELPETARPEVDEVKLAPEDLLKPEVKQIIDNFWRMRTYAKQLEVTIRKYNIYAIEKNMITSKSLDMPIDPSDVKRLEKLKTLEESR